MYESCLSDVFGDKHIQMSNLLLLDKTLLQAARPRVFTTYLQLGLGVQLHHYLGSKYLIETLYNLAFCCSYKEVQIYEQSAALTNNIEIHGYLPGQFMQYVAYNVTPSMTKILSTGWV